MAKSILKQLKEDEREVRRNLIINAAKSLYKKKSFHTIGMRDISREAGISVASLYQYFPSQDDLFVGILKTELESIKSKLWKERYSLEEISLNIVDFLMDHEDIFLMMSHFMVRGEKKPESLEKFNEIQDLFLEMLDSALVRTENKSVNHGFYSRAFFTALFGNVITFRNYTQTHTSQREILYYIVRITSRAFQEASKNPDDLSVLPGEDGYFAANEKVKSTC